MDSQTILAITLAAIGSFAASVIAFLAIISYVRSSITETWGDCLKLLRERDVELASITRNNGANILDLQCAVTELRSARPSDAPERGQEMRRRSRRRDTASFPTKRASPTDPVTVSDKTFENLAAEVGKHVPQERRSEFMSRYQATVRLAVSRRARKIAQSVYGCTKGWQARSFINQSTDEIPNAVFEAVGDFMREWLGDSE